MNKGRKFLVFMGVMVLCWPSTEAVKASARSALVGYQAYPTPSVKPVTCEKGQINEINMDKRQAAAAALGLFLGLKTATAPHGYQLREAALKNCAG